MHRRSARLPEPPRVPPGSSIRNADSPRRARFDVAAALSIAARATAASSARAASNDRDRPPTETRASPVGRRDESETRRSARRRRARPGPRRRRGSAGALRSLSSLLRGAPRAPAAAIRTDRSASSARARLQRFRGGYPARDAPTHRPQHGEPRGLGSFSRNSTTCASSLPSCSRPITVAIASRTASASAFEARGQKRD